MDVKTLPCQSGLIFLHTYLLYQLYNLIFLFRTSFVALERSYGIVEIARDSGITDSGHQNFK